MPLPFTIGPGRALMWRHPKAAPAPAGPSYLFRDQFDGVIKADWTNTGSVALYDNEASLIGTGTWGAERLKHTTGLARQDGRALAALVLPEDARAADLAVGWATGVVADPTTDGHSWLNLDGYFDLATPGRAVRLSGTGTATVGSQRVIEYYVIVVLRAQGAFYLVSTLADYAGLPSHSKDQVGIPQYPDARVLWVEDAATATPMYPVLSAGTTLNYPNGSLVDDVRVVDVADWQTDQGLATFLDRFDRADSTSSLGGSWSASGGPWGISSGKAYRVSGTGIAHASIDSGLSGDGIWRCKITAPTTTSNGFGIVIRRVDANNFIRVWNDGGNNITIQTWVAGGFGAQIGSYPVSWVAGQTYDLVVATKGAYYALWLDGVQLMDWFADPNSRHLTGSGFGPYTSTNPTGARWDDFMAVPHTVTLPAELQAGRTPSIWTPGAILMADTFTAADGTAIAGRTPDTPVGSNTWQVDGAGFQISGNALVNTNTNGADTADYAYYDVGATDVEVIANVTTPASGDVFRDGIVVRYASSTTNIHGRMFKDPAQVNADEVELWAIYAGSGANDLHKQDLGGFWAYSTTYELKLQIKGRLAIFFVDGQPIVAYHVPLAYTSTKIGIYHNRQDDGVKVLDITVRAL